MRNDFRIQLVITIFATLTYHDGADHKTKISYGQERKTRKGIINVI